MCIDILYIFLHSPQSTHTHTPHLMEFVGIMGLNIFVVALGALVVWSSGGVDAKVAQKAGCDIFNGDWVMDNSSSYPYYESSQCPFFQDQFNCRKNGRPDSDYTKYYWRPADGCLLPRFNGVEFMRKLKGKQVMFVGDSLSLNQWQSLTCLLHVVVPNAKYISTTVDGLSNFTIPDYNVSIMFSRNAFLVDITNETRGRVLRLDSISSSQIWGGMDYVIFDTWHWWNNTGAKQPWDWVVYGNTTVKDIDRMLAYEKALNTWANWIDSNVDPTKIQVFFQGVSPNHPGCTGKTAPLKNPGSLHPGEVVLEKILRGMDKPVFLLNITTMSQLRIDAHPSVYGFAGSVHSDCTHWCLSGVPDIWNEFLYALIN